MMGIAYAVFALATTRGVFNGGFTWDEGMSEYIPWRVEAGRQIAAGHFPFFTRNVFGGMPLFSLAYVGVLYPPNWLYAIFPPQLAGWLQVFHTVVGGMGMLHYLRARRIVTFAGFIGGLLFVANTFMVLHSGHIAMREAAMLAPWVALAALRVMQRPSFARAALLAVALALQIAAGYMQVTFFTVLWIAIDWLANLRRTRRFAAATALLAAGGLAGFALMAVQIMTTMQHVPQTPRVHMTLESWQIGSLPPRQAITFLIPRALGMKGGVSYPGETIVTIPLIGWMLALMGLLLVGMKPFRRRRRVITAIVYTSSIAVCVLLAFGQYLPINASLFHLPPFNMFRVPARWLLLASILASVLAAMGLQLFMRLAWRRAALALALIGILAAAIGGTMLFAGFHDTQTPVSLWDMIVRGIGTSSGRVSSSIFGGEKAFPLIDAPIVSAVLSLLVGIFLIFSRRHSLVIGVAAILLLGFDNYVFSKYGIGEPLRHDRILFRERQPLLGAIDPNTITRIYGLSPHGDNPGELAAPHDTALFLDLPTLNGYSPLLSDRLYITLGVGQSGVSHRDGEYYDRPIPLRNVAVSHLIVQTNALTRERRESYERQLASGEFYERIFSVEGYDLLRLRNSRPRFDLASQWTPPSGDQLQLDTYVFKNNPGAPLPASILENPDWDLLPPADTPIRDASVEVLLDEPSHQRVRIHAPAGAVLLVRDVFWNGWKYRVEGFDAKYHGMGRAEGVIRYAPIPKGDWEVDLKFTPPGWKTGLTVSIAALMLVLAGLFGEAIFGRSIQKIT